VGSGVRAILVFVGGMLFTFAIGVTTQYNLLALALGSIGSMLFALREGFSPGREGERGGEKPPTRWLWFVGVVVLALLTTTPVLAAFTPTASTSGGGGQQGGGGGGSAPSGLTPTCANPCTIVIKNSQFGSGSQLKSGNGYIVVKAGTTVTWENRDNTQHTTTSTDSPPIWDSGILNPGQDFSHTFSTPGTFSYICNVHPMAGTVIVVS
jgi:Copper binding proteins, plastocyanin/azurin family